MSGLGVVEARASMIDYKQASQTSMRFCSVVLSWDLVKDRMLRKHHGHPTH